MGSALGIAVPISHRDRLPRSSRYELLVKIASGGMATVYLGRQSSAVGTTRLVAIKRAHAHLLEDPAFSRMLIAEAKLASRIHHPNVVAVQNVEDIEGELLLVMDYVEGASLADLVGFDEMPMSARVAVRTLLDACAGLHAAHELTDDDGKRLGIVHRDVSPHNILVGVDGIARLTDFGIAKSSGHTASAGNTNTGALKGKVAYMAPEYVDSGALDARSDVFSLGIVAWEALTRRRLFRGANEIDSLRLVLATEVPRPSSVAPWLGSALDAVILKALARSPGDRFASAAELGEAIEVAARREDLIATSTQVGAFVRAAAGDALVHRRSLLKARHDESEIITASARHEEVTRAVIDAVEADAARPGVGRDERTVSLTDAAAPAAPARDVEVERVALPPAPTSDPGLPLDAPDGDGSGDELGASSGAERPAPDHDAASVAERAPAEDASTFGSGVSAQAVDEARGGRRAGRRRGVVVAFAIAGVLAVGATAAVLASLRAAEAPPAGAGSAAAVVSAPLATSVAREDVAAPVSAPSSAPAASSVAAIASDAVPAAPLPGAPRAAAPGSPRSAEPRAAGPSPSPSAKASKPRTGAPVLPAPATSAHAVSAPTATGTADRAPPNPYAH